MVLFLPLMILPVLSCELVLVLLEFQLTCTSTSTVSSVVASAAARLAPSNPESPNAEPGDYPTQNDACLRLSCKLLHQVLQSGWSISIYPLTLVPLLSSMHKD